jgi:6-phosphofructokinase 1
VIRAVVRKGILHYDDEFIGFIEGWRGVLENKTMVLDLKAVDDILLRGGTILRTSRTNPAKRDGGIAQCIETLKKNTLDALITLGGDDTQSVSKKLFEQGVKVVGVPKTIDNDLSGTDLCFGFDTAVSIATEAIDRVHTTAEAHNRVIVVEVMGRDSGWIAVYSGVASGADIILVPEKPFDLAEVAETLKQRKQEGHLFGIVVVAEGATIAGGSVDLGAAKDEFGHVRLGGIGNLLAQEIEKRTGLETRAVVLGHIQRGGTPTAFDRVLATRYGVGAIDMVHKAEFGRLAALKGQEIVSVPLQEALQENRKVPQNLLDVMYSLQEKRGAVLSR